MENPRIIYPNGEGGVAIIVPAPEALAKYGIDAIAEKDVPNGVPYGIVDASEIPEDRTFRGAWEVDVESLTSGVGSPITSFPQEGE